MNEPATTPDYLRALFPRAGTDLLQLLAGAAENASLLRTDFYTIRDLADLSGYTTDEPLHALLLAMLLALDEGSLCVEMAESRLTRRFVDLVPEKVGQAWSGRILNAVRSGSYPELIGKEVEDGKPLVLRRLGSRSFLYFQKYLKHELLLQTELNKRLPRVSGESALQPDLPRILREVFLETPIKSGGQPMKLSHQQRLAIGLGLVRDFLIISGGPGTGKTFIVTSLLRCLVRAGFAAERIALAAPTGRAAQRLTDALRGGLASLQPLTPGSPDATLQGQAAKTLHQLLGFQPARGTFRHHCENPVAADVIIVDEVSMVGLVLMAKLFQAAAPSAKIIFLGDKDQLPSVEAGAVLANLVPSATRPSFSSAICSRLQQLWGDLALTPAEGLPPLQDTLVVLERNYRSQQAIHKVARAVNAQETEVVDCLECLTLAPRTETSDTEDAGSFDQLKGRAGCWLLEEAHAGPRQWRRLLEQWADYCFLKAPDDGNAYHTLAADCVLMPPEQAPPEQNSSLDRLFALLGRGRVLTLVREGPWGCDGVNELIEKHLRPHLDRRASGRFFAGLPILISRNDHSRCLYNGDVGITLPSGAGGYRVVFQRPEGYVSFPAEVLPAHETAFACTVHKSQGSEYDQVLLVLPPTGGKRLLTKEMVYTGITRARQLAIIAGKREILRFAVARCVERESALLQLQQS